MGSTRPIVFLTVEHLALVNSPGRADTFHTTQLTCSSCLAMAILESPAF